MALFHKKKSTEKRAEAEAKRVLKLRERREKRKEDRGKPMEKPRKEEKELKMQEVEKPSREKKELKRQEAVPMRRNFDLATPIDDMIGLLLEKKKNVSFNDFKKKTGLDITSIEKIGLVLEKAGIADVHYPTMVTSNPNIGLIKHLTEKPIAKPAGEKIRDYDFIVDNVPVKVCIYESPKEQRPVYHIKKPVTSAYTQVFLDSLKEDISEKIPIEVSDIIDKKKALKLKERFFTIARQELEKYLKTIPPHTLDVLAGLMLQSLYGLGDIELIMGDSNLEEIAVNNSYTPVTIYHKELGWLKTNVTLPTEDSISTYSSQIGRKVGREITTLTPILDAHLISGDRVNATLAPISSMGNTITIRRFARKPWTIIDFIGKGHTMNIEMASLLWMAMQYEMNIIIAGGTASGKTSTLNALSAFIPAYHRVVSIEDVREIMLPKYMQWNWVPLTTRNPNPEGLGEVSMLELMQSSLRMRPDRIIVGEMRKKKEAEVLFEAMHTGHSVYSTLHANSSHEVLRRLTESPMSIPPLQIEAIDLLVVQYRDRKKNVRRTYEISEVETGVSEEHLQVNTIFKWQPRSDDWEAIDPASKFVRELNMHTGMTEAEITKDLQARAKILDWMLKNDLREINQVGSVMKLFYSNPDAVKKAAKDNALPKEVLGV
ncbi:MAG: Flp pilus assembly complex ATPase component TadA [Candidatus Diapherotrites archaeon]|nr:Flp pilus assembly complex ATPase component TadA [Candidatus Diapherotrites archaeon]